MQSVNYRIVNIKGSNKMEQELYNHLEKRYMEKVEGQPCPSCGKAEVIRNPSTGKLFCKDKCWLANTPDKPIPTIQQEEPPFPDLPDTPTNNDVWERKDRLHAAQTALNCAAMVFEGKETGTDDIKLKADSLYTWLMNKRA